MGKEDKKFQFPNRDGLAFEKGVMFALEVVSYSSVTNPVLMVGMTREGLIKFDVTSDGTGVANTKTFRISDIPIFLNIYTNSAEIERGEYFASVYLQISGERVAKLCSGYISKQSGISYPITHDESEIASRGLIKSFSFTRPAAGAELIKAIPDNLRWNLISMKMTLTTKAIVADRRVYLKIGTNTNQTAYQLTCISGAVQAENKTINYSFATYGGIETDPAGVEVLTNMPTDYPIISGGQINTQTKNIQADDQWQYSRIVVEEFIED